MKLFYKIVLGVMIVAGSAIGYQWFKASLLKQSLKSAAEIGDWATVAELVEKGANPNIFIHFKQPVPDSLVWSPLTAALYVKRHDIVKLLIDRGADVNMEGLYGIKPIYIPSQRHDLPMVELLLASGANPDSTDRMANDTKPFWSFLEDKDIEVLKLFVKFGANIKRKDDGAYLWDTENYKQTRPALHDYLKQEVGK